MPLPPDQIYISRDGDTFQSVSSIMYGDNSYADVIRTANPGVFEPMIANLLITIPLLPLAPDAPPPQPGQPEEPPIPEPGRVAAVPFNDPDDVTLLIGGINFRHWETVKITRTIDSFSTVTFTAPFEPSDAAFRAMFRPMSFKLIQVFVGGRPLFFGRILNVMPSIDADKRTVEVGCYSYAATVNDVTKALDTKADWKNTNIIDITKELVRPFAINVIPPADDPYQLDPFSAEAASLDPFDNTNNSYTDPFVDVSIKPKTKIIKFLKELAEQRKLIITDNANGDLVYTRVVQKGTPFAMLTEGLSPLASARINLNSQDWYSDVTGARAVKFSMAGTESFTVKNKFLAGVFRPYYFRVKDVDGPVKEATEAKFAQMIANVMTCHVELNTWRNSRGELFRPNTLIDITAPGAMIYNRYRFVVSEVVLTRDEDKKTAHLALSLPGSYTGSAPETLPWD